MAVQMAKTQNQNLPSLSMQKLKNALNTESVKEQFRNALNENAGAFVASIIDLYGSDSYLQQCDPNLVIMEALKLPINKQLGFAYIVPYRNSKGALIPQFQLGYKGYIQLAMRTGQYKHLNAGVVYEGIKVNRNILTGEIEFLGEPTSDKPQGYFAYMELLNGFRKTVYMTQNEVLCHAKRYSKSFNYDSSAWKTNFEEMAIKTVLRRLLSKYGMLSTDLIAALTSDRDEDVENQVADEIEREANKELIDIELETSEMEDEQDDEDAEGEPKIEPEQQQMSMKGPGF
jgi:recombination protein RecT